MTETNRALPLLTAAAQKLCQAFAIARDAGATEAAAAITRASVHVGSAIEQLIAPSDDDETKPRERIRVFDLSDVSQHDLDPHAFELGGEAGGA